MRVLNDDPAGIKAVVALRLLGLVYPALASPWPLQVSGFDRRKRAAAGKAFADERLAVVSVIRGHVVGCGLAAQAVRAVLEDAGRGLIVPRIGLIGMLVPSWLKQ